ncbi:hypothetical protein H6P81_000420 [Aristolochia fimbriata]|uniref:SWIM-type domain-containing protein n=1 Tax=Aristolochia fimbriata TaxID=158543 RepID=A0AAV7F800_ARIFI|nr:hypothetical protein H6P81_000420 [Aristolochia fimbriata]
MGETSIYFILHFDGQFEEGSSTYVGGRTKVLVSSHMSKFLDLVSSIHNRIGTNSSNMVLSIKCSYSQQNHVMIVDVEDDEDLQGVIGLSSQQGSHAVNLYIVKHPRLESTPSGPYQSVSSRNPLVDNQHKRPSGRCGQEGLIEGNDASSDKGEEVDESSAVEVRVNSGTDNVVGDVDEMDADLDFNSAFVYGDGARRDAVHASTNCHRPTSICGPPESGLNVDEQVTLGPLDGQSSAMFKLELGVTFKCIEFFKRVLREDAIRRNYAFRYTVICKVRCSAVCKDRTCKWKITVSKLFDIWKVKIFVDKHTCTRPSVSSDHPRASAAWIAATCMNRFSKVEEIKAPLIQSYIKQTWGLQVSYRKAHLAKEILSNRLHGSHEQAYTILPVYKEEIQKNNVGTVMVIARSCDLYGGDDKSFLRLFWIFGACRHAYASRLRPLLSVDSASLRGKYPGKFLVASGIDGNSEVIPLAYAVVEKESLETWSWFLRMLETHLLTVNNTVTIMSDWQNVLLQEASKEFPNTHYGFSVTDLGAKLFDTFQDEPLRCLFHAAAYTFRESEFSKALDAMKHRSEMAYKWVSGFPKERWANVYFKGNRYNTLARNTSECCSTILKDAGTSHIVQLIECTLKQSADLFDSRHTKGAEWTGRLTDYGEEHLRVARERGLHHRVTQVGQNEFMVLSRQFTDRVDLDRRTCTCGVFQSIGLPCEHAIVTIEKRSDDPYTYCEHWYRVDTYMAIYKETLHFTAHQEHWKSPSEDVIEVKTPKPNRQAGRPKSETPKKSSSRRICSKCGQLGHNKRSYQRADVTFLLLFCLKFAGNVVVGESRLLHFLTVSHCYLYLIDRSFLPFWDGLDEAVLGSTVRFCLQLTGFALEWGILQMYECRWCELVDDKLTIPDPPQWPKLTSCISEKDEMD